MPYRAIQPFLTLQRPDEDSGHKPPVKNRIIRVACEACRRAKAKNRECLFRGEEGQSWEAILKSRVESLEQRVHELQAGQTSRAQPAEPKESGPYNILVVSSRRFHKKAQAVYNSDAGAEDSNQDIGVLPTSYRLPIKELSFNLLVMLCRPFGDPSYRDSTKESLAATHRLDPSRYEHRVLVERLEWDFEDSVPFQWNPEMLRFGNAESSTSKEGVVGGDISYAAYYEATSVRLTIGIYFLARVGRIK
ncbi:hypothetical protein CIB48_g7197 [Xylaria polymorpha]|nr:hypothetical protein CIB48_g7197 [Xylaria polymorpha]